MNTLTERLRPKAARRILRAVATLSILPGLVSCAAHRLAAPDDPQLLGSTQDDRVLVAGYTTRDGQDHKFEGYLAHSTDSLVFVPRGGTPQGSREGVLTLSRDQVQSVKLTEGISVGRTVLFGLSLLGFFALMWAVVGGPVISPPYISG